MRIISGKYKGKRLVAPKKLPVRPTTDYAKEALFNILMHRIDFEEITLLDLYAGTGNISYEFGSRGTKDLTAVDSHYGCIKYIKSISEELNFLIKTIKLDVLKYLTTTSYKFSIIFADPPYHISIDDFMLIVNTVFKRDLLYKEGILIIEHSKHTDLSSNRYFNEARRYGSSVFSFFEK